MCKRQDSRNLFPNYRQRDRQTAQHKVTTEMWGALPSAGDAMKEAHYVGFYDFPSMWLTHSSALICRCLYIQALMHYTHYVGNGSSLMSVN